MNGSKVKQKEQTAHKVPISSNTTENSNPEIVRNEAAAYFLIKQTGAQRMKKNGK